MTESGQGSGQGAAPQAGAPWGRDPGYGSQEPGSRSQPDGPPAPGHGAQRDGAQQPEHHPGGYGAQEPRTPGGPAYGYPAQAPPGHAPQPGYGYPPAGHVVGPGFEGPGDPHGYGYPPLPEAVTQYIPPIPGTPGPVEAATQYIAPVPGPHEAATQYIAPVVDGPAHHEAATQYIAPVPGPHEAATQYIAPVPGPHEAATQYIAPVVDGPAHHEAATQYIAPVPGPHEAATQYIPPVPAAPSDSGVQGFDGLFRSDDTVGHTQQLPPVQEPVLRRAPRPRGPAGPPAGPVPPRQQYAPAPPPPPPAPPRKVSAGVIAAAVIGLAVAGLGVGSLLADGGGKAANSDPGAAVPAPTGSTETAADDAQVDPARPQAVQLDKVLADSNGSRAAVIKAVDDIKSCRNLDQAALELRDAARQREELVTRLQELKMDELPDHVKLSAALTKAWKSSAAADRGYASWADDVAHDKGGCKDGKAKSTDHAADGNKSSGEATRAKESAATMWNSIAAKYGLTRRDKTEL
ncbi:MULTISPECIES: hypothetical protein [unclassified Streptomyces]|uniref:hypothetical protein n=1 Tax=unclassified Streptomyces TaxID=2593676 RepID=UPI002E35BD12|nr:MULTISPECIES: hypothetical protein [unclassified Streptomyces]WUC65258.1 hypothetical protein OG861_13935 [Streptomyces sp. NBC_00539]